MSFAWAKLYFEILDDPKMARLPDHLWRRFSELILLAHELGEGGVLPDLSDMAWRLHCDEDDLESDLRELEKRTQTVTLQDGHWFVVNLKKRQGPMSDRERKRRQRARDPQCEDVLDRDEAQNGTAREAVTGCDEREDNLCHDAVTSRDTDKDKDLELDSETERERERETETVAKTTIRATNTQNSPTLPGRIDLCPGVTMYKRVVGREPPVALHPEIDECIGRDPPNLEFWAEVLRGWLSCGWNPGNVNGMLDHYERHEVPGVKQSQEHSEQDYRNDGKSYIQSKYAAYIKH